MQGTDYQLPSFFLSSSNDIQNLEPDEGEVIPVSKTVLTTILNKINDLEETVKTMKTDRETDHRKTTAQLDNLEKLLKHYKDTEQQKAQDENEIFKTFKFPINSSEEITRLNKHIMDDDNFKHSMVNFLLFILFLY